MNEKIKFRRFSPKLKTKYTSIDFKAVERYISFYKKRYHSQILPFSSKPKRDIGWRGSRFLSHSLQRSRILYLEAIDNINRNNRLSAFFTIRGHFETTGFVAYLYDSLQKFYDNQSDFDEIDATLGKLALGNRNFKKEDYTTENIEFPNPIRATKQVKKADHVFNKISSLAEKNDLDDKKNHFEDRYNFLSEFCHPNMLGLTTGAHTTEQGGIAFEKNSVLSVNDLNIFVDALSVSCGLFFLIYDRSYSLLERNEELPEKIK